jgi:ribosomal protein L25 (general stress protein Ctc)
MATTIPRYTIQALPRVIGQSKTGLGTNASEAMRKMHLVPGVLYGPPGFASSPICVESKQLMELRRRRGAALTNTLVNLQYNDKTYAVVPRHVFMHPLKSEEPQSANFLIYDPERGIKVPLPVKIINKEKCMPLRRGGFINVFAWHVYVKVRGAQQHLPTHITINVGGLPVGTKITWADVRDQFEGDVVPLRGGSNPVLINIHGPKGLAVAAAAAATPASSSAG